MLACHVGVNQVTGHRGVRSGLDLDATTKVAADDITGTGRRAADGVSRRSIGYLDADIRVAQGITVGVNRLCAGAIQADDISFDHVAGRATVGNDNAAALEVSGSKISTDYVPGSRAGRVRQAADGVIRRPAINDH